MEEMEEVKNVNEVEKTEKHEDMPTRDRLSLLLGLILMFLIAGFATVITLILQLR